MSRLVFFFPGNPAAHANLPIGVRRQYVGEFRAWRDLFRGCGLPVAMSLQRMDLLFTGMAEADFEGIELIGAPFSHLLPSLYEKGGDRIKRHLRWQFQEAAVNPHAPAYFSPEFDIPRTTNVFPTMDRPKQIIFAIPAGNTLAYSLCGAEREHHHAEGNLKEIEAIEFSGKVVVPMHGVEDAQKAFFAWQRFPDHPDMWADLIVEFEKLVNDGKDLIHVFFMDLEAVLIGSHMGLAGWDRFFAIMRERFLPHIVPLRTAADVWRARAKNTDGAHRYFARFLGAKWTGFNSQIDHIMATHKKAQNSGRCTDRRLAVIATSDVLCGIDRELRGSITLTADKGPVTIGVDRTVIKAGLSCLREDSHGPRGRMSVLGELARSRTEDGRLDEAWYFEKLNKIIEDIR